MPGMNGYKNGDGDPHGWVCTYNNCGERCKTRSELVDHKTETDHWNIDKGENQ